MKFKISGIRWYLVNLTNFRDPYIIKKHFLSKAHALEYKSRYFEDKDYDPVFGATALEMKLSFRKAPVSRIYDYGFDFHTKIEGNKIRLRRRRKLYRMLRKKYPLRDPVLVAILEQKPMLFIKRYKDFRDNIWAYSEPIPNFHEAQNKLTKLHEFEMLYPENFIYISNIIRTLNKYKYDITFYDRTEVALAIFKKWRKYFIKYLDKGTNAPIEKIEQEYIARGFIPIEDVEIGESDSYLKTVNLTKTLVFPKTFWHNSNDNPQDVYVYKAQSYYGIPGYCAACPAGLNKRK